MKLKNRLIPAIVIRNDHVVQSFNFEKFLPIGNIEMAIEFFVNWEVDEIAILDIYASKNKTGPNLRLVERAAKKCFLPLMIGGGIRTVEDIRNVIRTGADKVSVNTIAVEKPEFITEASSYFGSQCVTVSIDAKKLTDGTYGVFAYNGKEAIGKTPVEWAKEVEKRGAGEILLNSIDRDGSRLGYDLKLLQNVSQAVKIPVIALGGVGKVEHLSEGILDGRCQAASAANIFQHTEHSTMSAKAYMSKKGINIRLRSSVNYNDFSFDQLGRPF